MYYWIILLIIAYILNVYFTFLQMEKYKKALVKLKKEYAGSYISTGKSRKFLKGGSVTILAIGKDGRIKYGEQMKGRSVFADFKPLPEISGILVDNIVDENKDESIVQAIEFYKEYIGGKEELAV